MAFARRRSAKPADAAPARRTVAVVGSGISGLGAAWMLHRAGHAVTLFEAGPTLGGHTLTDASPGFPVDVGFQVFNLTTYPNLVAFLEALRVPSEPSDMSFALSVDGGALEWASHGLGSLFAQRENATNPSFLRMLREIVRFGRHAPTVLTRAADATISFGDYLKREAYSQFFVDNYVLPMCAAVWSVPAATVLTFPARMLIRFWVNHHLLDITARPVWRVVAGRSKTYVDAVAAELPDVRLNTPVTAVCAAGGGRPRPALTAAGVTTEYDAIVLAVHADTAAQLVRGRGVAAGLQAALDAIPYAANAVFVHRDAALMPRRRAAWASWNCIQAGSGEGGGQAAQQPVCVSYWCNSLQRLPPGAPDTFVTLNPPTPPAPALTHRRLTLHHPVFGPATPAAQDAVRAAQGAGGLFFAGAWMGYGFHEDGLKAAVQVATALGAPPPWAHLTRVPSPKLGWRDAATIAAFDRFARRAIRRGALTVVLPDGRQLEYGNVNDDAPTTRPGEEWHGAPRARATLRVVDASFFRALATRHDVGLGEAYMRGDIEVDDLGSLMAVAVANAPQIEASRGALGVATWIGDKLLAAAHAARANTREGSRANIEAHYDAGNAMYKLFLDESMTYSSALHSPDPADTLHAAQLRKLDALLDAAGIKDGDAVLEVGCGWGSMAVRALTRWPRVTWTGLTLSKQQLEEAAARVEAAGVADRCTLLLLDYRDVGPPPGAAGYDAIVSCEMIEAVGHDHLPAYFAALGRVLKPGGKAALQAISQPDGAYDAYRKSSDFIREHIFPGGHLVSAGAMVAAAKGTGLAMTACVDVGPQYAITLRAWRAAWERERDAVLALGYPDSFWRKYRFYFAYCEAGFDARKLRNYQAVFTKNAVAEADDGAVAAAPRAAAAPALTLAAALAAAWLSGALALLAATGGGAGVSTPAGSFIAAAAAIAIAASAAGVGKGVQAVKAGGSEDGRAAAAHAHEE